MSGDYMLTLFFIVFISGSLGGLIFALHVDHTHELTFPWDGKSKDTGWLGHIIIGVGGSVVAIAIFVAVMRYSLDELIVVDSVGVETVQRSNPSSVPASLPASISASTSVSATATVTAPVLSSKEASPSLPDLKSAEHLYKTKRLEKILFLLSIGILGGYSGLRIISGMSDAMMRKLQSELDKLEKNQSERDRQYQKDKKKQQEDIKSYEKKIKDLTITTEVQKGIAHYHSENFQQAAEQLKLCTAKYPEKLSAWAWLASTYRQLGKLDEAIVTVNKAIEISPNHYLPYYNKACYLLLTKSPISDVFASLESALSKLSTLEEKATVKATLLADKDLLSLKDEDTGRWDNLIKSLD
ncbi:tetratricopeptide repeat protein [Vibrio lentus]|nr:tetratricopeptide repeat protein [Vibrio lentus]